MTTQKYDVRAIALAHQEQPHFLSCSRDGKLIMRRDEKGGFVLLAHDQETVVEMSATDARDFALWVLMANAKLTNAAPVETAQPQAAKPRFGAATCSARLPFEVRNQSVIDADGSRVIVCAEDGLCPMFFKEEKVDADGHFMCPECGRLGQRMVELRPNE